MLFWIKVYNANEYTYSMNNVGVYVKNKTTNEEIFILNGFIASDCCDEEDGLYTYFVNVHSSVPHFVVISHT